MDPQEQFFILPLILSAKRKIIIIWRQEIRSQKEFYPIGPSQYSSDANDDVKVHAFFTIQKSS